MQAIGLAMKGHLKIQMLLVLLVLPIGVIPFESQKVKIVAVNFPEKVFNLQPFQIQVTLHASQPGGTIRVSLLSGGASLVNATSGLLLGLTGSEATVSLPLQLPWSLKPYDFDLLAYWDATLGGETLEDRHSISIQSVIVSLLITGSSQPAVSNSRFNVTFTLKNNGTDIARSVSAHMTGLGGFGLLQNGNIDLGDLAPGQSKQVTFALASNPYDLIPGERELTLSVSFSDWAGTVHSQTAMLSVYLQVSLSTISFWTYPGIVILVVIIGVILILLKRIRSLQVGRGGVTIRR